MIALLIQYPPLHKRLTLDALQELAQAPGADLLTELCAHLHELPDANAGRLLALLQEHPQHAVLTQLAAWEHHLLNDDGSANEEQLRCVLDDNLDKLLQESRQDRAQFHADDLQQRVASGTASAEEKAAYLRLIARKQ